MSEATRWEVSGLPLLQTQIHEKEIAVSYSQDEQEDQKCEKLFSVVRRIAAFLPLYGLCDA